MKVNIPVSPAELIDKITILEIKSSKVKDAAKLTAVTKELNALKKLFENISSKHSSAKKELTELKKKLSSVNKKLWRIEDAIRNLENVNDFGFPFVNLARMVYKTNDKRSAIKKKINELLNSDFGEVKQYASYSR